MDYLEWNDNKMSIGIKLIDEQHKELLKIINKLSTSINENSQRKDILIIVNELIGYASYHFTVEEELFNKFNYKDSEEHKKEHSLFVKKFRSIKNKISNDKVYLKKSAIEISGEVFQYIVDWFLNHVVGSDKKYVELFKKNGIK